MFASVIIIIECVNVMSSLISLKMRLEQLAGARSETCGFVSCLCEVFLRTFFSFEHVW